ncbi:MAG: hypothetical protein M1824_004177 [Vezdaea acicularis]|nr:MAG: hypothetical protein M1824_004177 [Vezdaea acicularis]
MPKGLTRTYSVSSFPELVPDALVIRRKTHPTLYFEDDHNRCSSYRCSSPSLDRSTSGSSGERFEAACPQVLSEIPSGQGEKDGENYGLQTEEGSAAGGEAGVENSEGEIQSQKSLDETQGQNPDGGFNCNREADSQNDGTKAKDAAEDTVKVDQEDNEPTADVIGGDTRGASSSAGSNIATDYESTPVVVPQEKKKTRYRCTFCWRLSSQFKPVGPEARIACRGCWKRSWDLAVCWGCGELIARDGREAGVAAFGWCFWHLECFGCLVCRQPLTLCGAAKVGEQGIEVQSVPICEDCEDVSDTEGSQPSSVDHIDGAIRHVVGGLEEEDTNIRDISWATSNRQYPIRLQQGANMVRSTPRKITPPKWMDLLPSRRDPSPSSASHITFPSQITQHPFLALGLLEPEVIKGASLVPTIPGTRQSSTFNSSLSPSEKDSAWLSIIAELSNPSAALPLHVPKIRHASLHPRKPLPPSGPHALPTPTPTSPSPTTCPVCQYPILPLEPNTILNEHAYHLSCASCRICRRPIHPTSRATTDSAEPKDRFILFNSRPSHKRCVNKSVEGILLRMDDRGRNAADTLGRTSRNVSKTDPVLARELAGFWSVRKKRGEFGG